MEFKGVDPEFVHPPSDLLKCPLCSKVLKVAVQTSCGHRFCKECITSKLQSSENNECFCPTGEDTCEMLTENEIHPDFSTRKEIGHLSVYCTFRKNGCENIIKFKDLKKETQNCPFREVACAYVDTGCIHLVVYKDLRQHTLSCNFRPTKCPLCDIDVPSVLLKDHQEKVCSMCEIPCPYQCSIPCVQRKEIENHMAVCENRPFECKFKAVGCSFMDRKDKHAAHELENLTHHLELVTVFSAGTELHNLEMKTELENLRTDKDEMEVCLNKIKEEFDQLLKNVELVKSSIRDVMLKTVSQTEKLISLERRLGQFVSTESAEKLGQEIKTLRSSLSLMNEKIHKLEELQNNAVTSAQSKETVALLNRHDNQLGIQNVCLAELDMRMQLMETASHDGIMIWKIKDYSKRKQEAITGRTSSLYSQPFFSSRTGYKMCARAYLNGDGIGKGTHMSLFFVVMKGEYDAILPWPFSLRITLNLLEQYSGTRHLSESFSPDPRSSSFQRPISEMNIASGCPVFVSHATLEESENYIRDDTLFLKISVT